MSSHDNCLIYGLFPEIWSYTRPLGRLVVLLQAVARVNAATAGNAHEPDVAASADSSRWPTPVFGRDHQGSA